MVIHKSTKSAKIFILEIIRLYMVFVFTWLVNNSVKTAVFLRCTDNRQYAYFYRIDNRYSIPREPIYIPIMMDAKLSFI